MPGSRPSTAFPPAARTAGFLPQPLLSAMRLKALPLAMILSGGSPAAGQILTITDAGQGRINHIQTETPEMSGISWMAGPIWHAVSDAAGERKVHEWKIEIDPATGRINNFSFLDTYILAVGHDLEGIAWCHPRGSVFVSDEGHYPQGGHLREHLLPGGCLLREVELPAVMLRDRQNFGLESSTWGAGALWTANEEALEHESALSSATTGSLVRLQRFDHRLQAAGQWAYRTDPKGAESIFTNQTRSGVVDLVALPDGRLLVLERTLGLSTPIPTFRNRLYLVGFTGATETSAIPNLDEAVVTPVAKSLLWEQNHGSLITANFEGIGLGPQLVLADGLARSLILVADNGGDSAGNQHFLALVLRGLEEPGAYTAWCQSLRGQTPAQQAELAPTADPDGDGLPNLVEYAFGSDPFDARSRRLPVLEIDEDGTPHFRFTRNRSHHDLTMTIQSAPDPAGPWTAIARSTRGGETVALAGGIEVTESGDWLERTVGITHIVAPGRLFLRVELSL
jgi:hypothetical protein